MNSRKLYAAVGRIAPLHDLVSALIGYERSVSYFVLQLPFGEDASIRVLDAGCGTGLYSLALLKKYKNAHITAFDLDAGLVTHLQEKLVKNRYDSRARLFTANIQHCLEKIGKDEFDLIITAGVLEYVPLEQTVRYLSKALVSGGYFFNSPVRNTLYGKLVGRLWGCKPYSRAENIGAFERSGFSLQKIISLHLNPLVSFKEAHLFRKD